MESTSAWRWYTPQKESSEWQKFFCLERSGGWSEDQIFSQVKVGNPQATAEELVSYEGIRFQVYFCPDQTQHLEAFKNDERYIKLVKKDRAHLVLGERDYGTLKCPDPVYVSLDFFKAQGLDEKGNILPKNSREGRSYPWGSDRMLIDDPRFPSRDRATGLWRYIPVRDENGQGLLLPLSSSVKNEDLKNPEYWAAWLKNGAKLSSGRYCFLRSLNPDNLTLWIRSVDVSDAVQSSDLKEVFENFSAKDGVKTAYLVDGEVPLQERSKYVYLSGNPFGHYTTWITRSDLKKYLKQHPGRPHPDEEQAQAADKTIPKDSPAHKRAENNEKAIIALQHWLLKPLSDMDINSDKIKKASGRRPEVDSQGRIMGSATNIATECFQWSPDEGSSTNRLKTGMWMAEWLHLAAFSWGGLLQEKESFDAESSNFAVESQEPVSGDLDQISADVENKDQNDKRIAKIEALRKKLGTEGYVTSQIPLNLIFGTSETNSVMTRHETAWQNLFLMEAELRKQLPLDIGNSRVQGNLVIFQNDDGPVFQTNSSSLDDVNASPIFIQSPNEELERLQKLSDQFEWLKFALEYYVSMNWYSAVLAQWNPSFKVTFYPFTRFFFTRGESLADKAIISRLYERAKRRLVPRYSHIDETGKQSSPQKPKPEKKDPYQAGKDRQEVYKKLADEVSIAKEKYKSRIKNKEPYQYQLGSPYLEEEEVKKREKDIRDKLGGPDRSINWGNMDKDKFKDRIFG